MPRNRQYEIAAAVGAVLREVMHEQGVTQIELAARMDTDQGTVSRYLSGRHDTSVGFLDRICKALGTTPAAVLNRVNSRYRQRVA